MNNEDIKKSIEAARDELATAISGIGENTQKTTEAFRELLDPNVPYRYNEQPMVPEATPDFDCGQPACIKSKFNWCQEVWFVDQGRVFSGKITGIKGEQRRMYMPQPVILMIDYQSPPRIDAPQVGCTFHKKEDECFASLQELKDFLFPEQ